MWLINLRRRMFKPLMFLLAGMILGLAVIYSCSISVFADDPAPGRTPGVATVSTSSLSHSHRGSSASGGQCYSVAVRHQHSGSSSGGGCYTRPHYHQHGAGCYGTCNYAPSAIQFVNIEDTYCGTHGPTYRANYIITVTHQGRCGTVAEDRPGTVYCNQCGGDPAAGMTGSHQYLACNRGGSVEYYEPACGKTEGVSVDQYNLGCGLDSRAYGGISLTNTTPEWTSGNVTLQGALSDPEGVICAGGYGQMSFGAVSGTISDTAGDGITVSENGVYTMNVSVDGSKFDTAQASVMLTVANIDRTEPGISDTVFDSGENWLRTNTVTVNAVDLQPDGTAGSGLADEAYSYDGGLTWTSDPTYIADSNGTVDISVRDYCGNISYATAEITNIDDRGPEVSYTYDPEVWYGDSGERTFTFTASDDQGGLDEKPFSYDGGQTWTDSPVLPTTEPGTIHVIVKDALGNTTELEIENKCDVRPAPAPDPVDHGGNTGSGDGGNGSDSGGNNGTDGNGGSGDTGSPGDSGAGDGDAGNSSAGNDGNNGSSDNGTDDGKSDAGAGAGASSSGSGHNTGNGGGGDHSSGSENGNGGNDAGGSGAGDGTEAFGDGNSSSANTSDGSEDTDAVEYFEQLPASSAAADISRRSDTISETTPFYRTKAFKAVASVSGGMLAAATLLLLFMLFYSGVIIYTLDTDRYRLMGIRPISRSERGNCIHLSREFMDNAYSSRYKLKLGRFYVMRHKDDLFNIDADDDWVSVKVERDIYVILK
ncbi:hypothetical protein SAMN02910292_00473 [Lachnospiraceae bacterium XBB2008]|nr:hypothetical protein SAMN02910292_00473 [Lachnospiraceae bacterium XBB2008]